MNKMREVKLEKVVLNIGAGESGEKVDKAVTLLERISSRKPVVTRVGKKVRIPKWGLRPKLKIGAKVTLRGTRAVEVLNNLLEAKERRVTRKSFSDNGNFSFGVAEYIDIPAIEYDPKLGIMGLDVCVKLGRAGNRIARRKIHNVKVPVRHRLTKEESIAFMEKTFKVNIE